MATIRLLLIDRALMSTLPTASAPRAPPEQALAHPSRPQSQWRPRFRRLQQGGWRSGWVLAGTGLAVLGLMHLMQPDDSQADLARTLLGLGCVAVIRLLPGPRRGP